jgi:predicted lactoylglutathione lyase
MATQPRKIFVNLPVKNLDRSMTFFKALGFTLNAQFTDETAACMVISDDIYAMLLTHKKFKEFTPKACRHKQDFGGAHLPFGGKPG